MSGVYSLWFVVMIPSSDRTINEHSIRSLNVCAAEKQIVNKIRIVNANNYTNSNYKSQT